MRAVLFGSRPDTSIRPPNRVRIVTFPVVFLLLGFALASASAEEYGIEYITRDDGLANSSVSSIAQDRWGFMWFGTQGGLQKYDGYGFKVYGYEPYSDNCLSHNLVQTMYLEKTGDVLWVGTYGGLNRFDLITERFVVFTHDDAREDSLSNDVVVSILKDSYGDLWVGTLDGLNVMKNGTSVFRRYRNDPADPSSLAGNIVRSIYEDRKGNLWIGTTAGFQRYDREDDSFMTFGSGNIPRETFPGMAVMSICEDPDGVIWTGTWGGGVTSFDPSTGKFRALALPGDNMYALFIDGTGTLLAATWGQGLLEIDRKTYTVTARITAGRKEPGKTAGISHNTVYSLFEDRSGLLWIGTNGGGLNKYDRRTPLHRIFTHDPENRNSITRGKINCVYEDRNGIIWAGIYNGGLDRLDPSTGTWKHYSVHPDDSDVLHDESVHCIIEDSSGRFFIGTQKGMMLFDGRTGRFSMFLPRKGEENPIGDEIIYAFSEDARGRLWIGTYHAGVTVHDPSTGGWKRYSYDPSDPGSLSNNLVFGILQDTKGNTWIGTNDGLNRYDPSTDGFVRYKYDPKNSDSLSGNTVRALHEDSRGTIWVGTLGGGLSRYDAATDTFDHFYRSHGLPDNSVLAVLDDARGNLWVNTPNGPAIFDEASGTFIRQNENNGILAREGNVGNLKTKAGTLYFGSLEGLQEIRESETAQADFTPKVVFTGFSVINSERKLEKPVFETASITLTYAERHFGFNFAALDYTDPSGNRFSYMLEGFEKEWNYPGTRNYVSYTNIPPGKYTLRVRAYNADGRTSPNEAVMRIVVLHPWWGTVPAWLMYILIAFGVFYAVHAIMSGRMLRIKVEELNRTREELKEANKKLEMLSTIDDLTGIPNKRFFSEMFQREWKQCAREQSVLSILMLDLDFFKAYNDNYGHLAGDTSLNAAANVIVKQLERPRDMVARFGGEEFVVLLPETEAAGAMHVAEKIRTGIQNLGIQHCFSLAAPWLTVSIGITTVSPDPGRPPEEGLEEADTALYQAKRAGRNRVFAFQPARRI